jgi:hypothetical protein
MMILSEVPNYEQIVSADVILILQTVLAVMLAGDCGFSLEEQLGKMINSLGRTWQNNACGICSLFCFCAEWASGKKLYKVVMQRDADKPTKIESVALQLTCQGGHPHPPIS